MAKKAKKSPISFERQMKAVLRINDAAVPDREDVNYIQLKIGLKLGFWAKLLNVIYKVRDYRKYLLTDFNCTLYRFIKEKTPTMRELIQWMMDREKLSFFEARNLLLDYVGNLLGSALVVAEIPPEEPVEEDEDGHPIVKDPGSGEK